MVSWCRSDVVSREPSVDRQQHPLVATVGGRSCARCEASGRGLQCERKVCSSFFKCFFFFISVSLKLKGNNGLPFQISHYVNMDKCSFMVPFLFCFSAQLCVYCEKQFNHILKWQCVITNRFICLLLPVSVLQWHHGGVRAGDNAGWDDSQCSI